MSLHISADFFLKSMQENGNRVGSPVALEGMATALKTVIAGETDLNSAKHLARCHMSEWKNSFLMISDDPDLFDHVDDLQERTKLTREIHDRVESAAVMWILLKQCFSCRHISILKLNLLVRWQFRVVKNLRKPREVAAAWVCTSATCQQSNSRAQTPTVRSYTAPHYEVETEGHWRRLPRDQYGVDAGGNSIRGKTWVSATNKWRERSDRPRTIYVKSSVQAARIKIREYMERAEVARERGTHASPGVGVVYVLRCTVMKDEVYKVGWTSGTAEERAKELSAGTGVPNSFVVVASWEHFDPEGLEKGIHALLAPYRINERREFFEANYETIKGVVDAEIKRTMAKREA